jgi:hypothetical protein
MYEEDIEDFLEHHGVKGMHWGVRKGHATPGVSRQVDKTAAKDAKEFARAKMFFGEGAGTRRKLIRETVNARKAKDPNYAKAFEAHLQKQDLSTHADKAQSERKRIDRSTNAKRSAGFIARKFTGEMGTTAAFTAVALGGAAFLNSNKGRSMMTNVFNKASDVVAQRKRSAGAQYLTDYFKKNG